MKTILKIREFYDREEFVEEHKKEYEMKRWDKIEIYADGNKIKTIIPVDGKEENEKY